MAVDEFERAAINYMNGEKVSRVPAKITVAGIEYSVKEVDMVIVDSSTEYAGSIDYGLSEIQILRSLAKTKKEQTLVHEILHACFREAGYDDQDEDVVNRVGIVLYQVLKDNDLTFK